MTKFRKIDFQGERNLRSYKLDRMATEDFILTLKEGNFDYIGIEGLERQYFMDAFNIMKAHQRQGVYWRICHYDYCTISSDGNFFDECSMSGIRDKIYNIPVKTVHRGTPILLVRREPVSVSYLDENEFKFKTTQDYGLARPLTTKKA